MAMTASSGGTIVLDEVCVKALCSGQVITSPSSAIRELIDNALDAGCTTVEISISDGGLSKIIVRDDGVGIPHHHFDAICKRNVTNKLKQVEDLLTLSTFGFRGEALNSLALLSSELFITSRTKDEELGRKYKFNFGLGKMEFIDDKLPVTVGTTVTVNGLFHQLPVRLLEMKKSTTKEISIITRTIQGYMLSHPHIGISLSITKGHSTTSCTPGPGVIHDTGYTHDTLLSIPSDEKRSINQVMQLVFKKKKNIEYLVPISASVVLPDRLIPTFLPVRERELQITGFIISPYLPSSELNDSFFFINRRSCVVPGAFKKKLEMALKEKFNFQAKVFFILFLKIDPALADVNFTPDKKIVSLSNETEIYGLVVEEIKNALLSISMPTSVLSPSKQQEKLPFSPVKEKIPAVVPGMESIAVDIVASDMTIHTGPSRTVGHTESSSSNINTETSPFLVEQQKKEPKLPKLDRGNLTPMFSSFSRVVQHGLFAKKLEHSVDVAGSFSPPQESCLPFLPDEPAFKIGNKICALSKEDFLRMKVIGQFNLGFIISLLEDQTERLIFIMDQHACDEKFNYENILSSFTEKTLCSQKLLSPIPLNLTAFEISILKTNQAELETMGFTFLIAEQREGNLVALWTGMPSLPVPISKDDLTELIRYLAEVTVESASQLTFNERIKKFAASKACRSSIMIGSKLSHSQMQKIVNNLSLLDQPWVKRIIYFYTIELPTWTTNNKAS